MNALERRVQALESATGQASAVTTTITFIAPDGTVEDVWHGTERELAKVIADVSDTSRGIDGYGSDIEGEQSP